NSMSLQLVVTNHSQAFLVRTDSSANQARGTLDLQQASSPLNGRYALIASGVTTGASAARFAEAGSLPIASGSISGGTLDVNTSTGTPVSVTGSSTSPSNGRGTLSLSPSSGSSQSFAYYPI